VAEMAEIIARHQDNKSSNTDLQKILNELESLSDEEAQLHFDKSRAPGPNH
jgi:hypothetical protein